MLLVLIALVIIIAISALAYPEDMREPKDLNKNTCTMKDYEETDKLYSKLHLAK